VRTEFRFRQIRSSAARERGEAALGDPVGLNEKANVKFSTLVEGIINIIGEDGMKARSISCENPTASTAADGRAIE
jgi:hypothetical protein